jgi:hypothetical protein
LLMQSLLLLLLLLCCSVGACDGDRGGAPHAAPRGAQAAPAAVRQVRSSASSIGNVFLL